MSRKLCLLMAALCVAATVVKSESYIEVDENGDEYEIKRFNIQGRQLNGGRPQCVVTRRKRSTVVYSNEDESDETDEKDYQSYSQASALLFYSPPVIDEDEDNEVIDEDEDEPEAYDNDNHESNGATFAVLENDNVTEEEDDDDDDPETIKVIQVPELSVISDLHNQGQTLGQIASSAHFLPASTAAAVSVSPNRNKGIMVYHTHEPPKVNPQTHAVFELVPVKQELQSAQSHQHDANDQVLHLGSSGYIVPGELNDNDDFKFDEEVNPVTTTAIWSTGDDDNYAYPLPPKIDKDPVETETSQKIKDDKYNIKTKPKAKKKKSSSSSVVKKLKSDKKTPMRKSSHKNARRPSKNPKRRPADKKRPINRRRPISRRRPATRKRPSSNIPRRYRKRNKSNSRGFSKTRKPNTAKRIKNERIVTTSPIGEDIGEMDEDKTQKKDKDKLSEQKQRNIVHDNHKEVGRRYRKRNNANIADPKANSYIRAISMTQMNGSNEHGDINCIYINKDAQPTKPTKPTKPPTTTRRPFLNLMGRNANVRPIAASHYGKRKRLNMRILV